MEDTHNEDADLQAAIAISLGQTPKPEAAPPTARSIVVDVSRIIELAWGDTITNDEVIQRWLQGFVFSADEGTALVQTAGGPCGVIAAVQGFMLTSLLPNKDQDNEWRSADPQPHLIKAIVSLLSVAATKQASPVLVAVREGKIPDIETFHSELLATEYSNGASLESAVEMALPNFASNFGVLLMLYSVMLSRGLEKIEDDMGWEREPFITSPFGHANQSLVNLLLTGQATPHVHDGEKDVGGLMMRGIMVRPATGYLTLLESMRYTTVGSLLKSPRHPVWIIGSESHFTVLFARDKSLVSNEESPVARATRIFGEIDGTGGGYIMADALPGVLSQLGFDSSQANVSKLAAQMGGDIILRGQFLETLYPGQTEAGVPSEFELMHYNGIASPGGVVKYVTGRAKPQIPLDFSACDLNAVLHTRWEPLDVTWDGDPKIKLNDSGEKSVAVYDQTASRKGSQASYFTRRDIPAWSEALLNRHSSIMKLCWILPGEQDALRKAASQMPADQRWIYKPVARGEGYGIAVANTAQEVVDKVLGSNGAWFKKYGASCVVQPLLMNPLLVQGRKFDLRLYMLVSGIAPLRAYLLSKGLVRLARNQYKDGTRRSSWITNTFVARKKGSSLKDVTWSVGHLFHELEREGHKMDAVWNSITDVVSDMILVGHKRSADYSSSHGIPRCNGCFQLIGVDIIFDTDLRPIVIETNGQPSMKLDSVVPDYTKMKQDLIEESLRIMFGTKGVDRIGPAVANATRILNKLESKGKIRLMPTGQSCDCEVTDAGACIDEHGLKYLAIILVEKQELKHFSPVIPNPRMDDAFINSYNTEATCLLNQIKHVVKLVYT